MGHVEVAHVSHTLPNGRVLLDDVSFRVGEGVTVALVGPNGAGKTTLLRLIAGDLTAQQGTVNASGGLGVMRQFIGGIRDSTAVRELLLSVAPPRIREAAAAVEAAELVLMSATTSPPRSATPTRWRLGRRGRLRRRKHWDICCVAVLGVPYDSVPVAPGHHPVRR